MQSGVSPLEFLVDSMRKPKPKRRPGEKEGVYDCRVLVWEDRCFQAAKTAAPYLHPRLQAVEHSSGTDDDPSDRCIRVTFVSADGTEEVMNK